MKRFFLILVLALGSLVPIKANAVDLKLTYDNDFKKKRGYAALLGTPSFKSLIIISTISYPV